MRSTADFCVHIGWRWRLIAGEEMRGACVPGYELLEACESHGEIAPCGFHKYLFTKVPEIRASCTNEMSLFAVPSR